VIKATGEIFVDYEQYLARYAPLFASAVRSADILQYGLLQAGPQNTSSNNYHRLALTFCSGDSSAKSLGTLGCRSLKH
jgi:hypothetical protein